MLTIDIYSFGFRSRGIPANEWGDGGGFVFDCRFLPNPYRVPELKMFTGRDKPIIEYFSRIPEISEYIDQCVKMIETSAEKYQLRDFKHLQVALGCTGGQHRSVYCSEQIFKILSDKGFSVKLKHTELQEVQ